MNIWESAREYRTFASRDYYVKYHTVAAMALAEFMLALKIPTVSTVPSNRNWDIQYKDSIGRNYSAAQTPYNPKPFSRPMVVITGNRATVARRYTGTRSINITLEEDSFTIDAIHQIKCDLANPDYDFGPMIELMREAMNFDGAIGIID